MWFVEEGFRLFLIDNGRLLNSGPWNVNKISQYSNDNENVNEFRCCGNVGRVVRGKFNSTINPEKWDELRQQQGKRMENSWCIFHIKCWQFKTSVHKILFFVCRCIIRVYWDSGEAGSGRNKRVSERERREEDIQCLGSGLFSNFTTSQYFISLNTHNNNNKNIKRKKRAIYKSFKIAFCCTMNSRCGRTANKQKRIDNYNSTSRFLPFYYAGSLITRGWLTLRLKLDIYKILEVTGKLNWLMRCNESYWFICLGR